jgi:hypothetical protein
VRTRNRTFSAADWPAAAARMKRNSPSCATSRLRLARGVLRRLRCRRTQQSRAQQHQPRRHIQLARRPYEGGISPTTVLRLLSMRFDAVQFARHPEPADRFAKRRLVDRCCPRCGTRWPCSRVPPRQQHFHPKAWAQVFPGDRSSAIARPRSTDARSTSASGSSASTAADRISASSRSAASATPVLVTEAKMPPAQSSAPCHGATSGHVARSSARSYFRSLP